MRLHEVPRPLLQLLATFLFAPRLTSAFALPSPAPTAGVSINELFARACTPCGYYSQLCCYEGTGCYTDSNSQATCTPNSGGVSQAAGGTWQYYTTTYVETDYVTKTAVMSSWVPTATQSVWCDKSQNQSPCGPICCASDQYCFSQGQCSPAAGSGSSDLSSVAGSTGPAGAPIRPTTSGTYIITATVSPSTTVPFVAPVPTGANVTVTSGQSNGGGGGGLSGGAIAGIVIGVLAGLLLLALLCFYCCVRGLWAACFGGKKKRRTEVDEYERHSHHTSGGGGRTWYGAARPPARVDRKEKHSGANLLGVGAGLAALWAILGLKRRRDNRHNEKYSEYSHSSDYYTSASE